MVDSAFSDDDPNVDYELRLPYAVDVVNAVRAVKRSDLPYLDGDRVGLLGRSMGGNVTLNALVARPGLVDAAVLYASTSSLAADNWRQFYRPSAERSRINARMERTYGLPGQSPRFWRAASPRPYFDRITAPVLMHHGTLDDSCPIGWSRATLRALEDAGKRARLMVYARPLRRAAEAGVSVPELLRAETAHPAARPSVQEWLARTHRRSSPLCRTEILSALDEQRGSWPDADR